MTFVSLLAETASQGTGPPAWLAGFIGTLVGGAITFFSARAADRRKEAAESRRQHYAQIKDVSVRFLRALTAFSISANRYKEIGQKNFDTFEAILREIEEIHESKTTSTQQEENPPPTSESPQIVELRARIEELTSEIRTKADAAKNLSQALSGVDVGLIRELDSVISEMQLIMPTETVHKAEKASHEVVKTVATAYFPSGKQPDRALARNATNEFVSDVRKLLGLGPYELLDQNDEFSKFLDEMMGLNRQTSE